MNATTEIKGHTVHWTFSGGDLNECTVEQWQGSAEAFFAHHSLDMEVAEDEAFAEAVKELKALVARLPKASSAT